MLNAIFKDIISVAKLRGQWSEVEKDANEAISDM